MGRKPNYSFERNNRAKAKAAKKEAKREAKAAARAAKAAARVESTDGGDSAVSEVLDDAEG
jgi:hypothetical protein